MESPDSGHRRLSAIKTSGFKAGYKSLVLVRVYWELPWIPSQLWKLGHTYNEVNYADLCCVAASNCNSYSNYP